ncbi:MAG TPA: AgmX/PglI C-terminal domain-containing protein [Polyangiaceae bacterium]
MARLVAAKCPNCGANVRIDPASDYATCSYCHTSSFVQTPKRRLTEEARAHHQPAFEVAPSQHGTLVAVFAAAGVVLIGTVAVVVAARSEPSPSARKLETVSEPEKLPSREPSRDWVVPGHNETPKLPPPVLDDGVAAAATSSKARSKSEPGRALSGLEPRVRDGAITVSGRLDRGVIQSKVRAQHGRFRACYEQALARDRSLRGRLSVRFVIGRDGAVSNVSNGGSELADSAMNTCVIRAFYGLSFPAPESGIVTVLYPVSFEAVEKR